MDSILESFLRWKSNCERKLHFPFSQPSVLQNSRCDRSGISEPEVHRHNTRAVEDVREAEFTTCDQQSTGKLPTTENVRVSLRKTGGCDLISKWSLSQRDGRIFVFRVYDNGKSEDECYSCPTPDVPRVVG